MKRSYFNGGICGDGTRPAMPRSCSADADQAIRLHQQRRPARSSGGRRTSTGYSVPTRELRCSERSRRRQRHEQRTVGQKEHARRHRTARRSGRARRPSAAAGQARPDLGRNRRRDPGLPAVRVDPLDHRTQLRAGSRRADRPADVHEGDPLHVDSRDRVGLPIAIWWFIIRPWRRERRITLDGMLFVSMRPDVLPGSAAELLQHVEHVQHLDVEPGFVGPGHSGLGVVRATGPHDGRTASDERAGLLLRPAVHDARLLGHAHGQDSGGPTSTPSA